MNFALVAQWIEYLASLPAVYALVVKWISRLASDQEFQVRVLARARLWLVCSDVALRAGRRGTKGLQVRILPSAQKNLSN